MKSSDDKLSDEIDEAIRRVRAVQRKRLLVSLLTFGIAAAIIVGGEILVVLGASAAERTPVMAFALPFAVGLPPAWLIRTALWPKDPVI